MVLIQNRNETEPIDENPEPHSTSNVSPTVIIIIIIIKLETALLTAAQRRRTAN